MKVPQLCPLCGKANNFEIIEAYKDHDLYQCSVCQGQFWWPMKNPGPEWYEKDERYSFRKKNPQLQGLGLGPRLFFSGHHKTGKLLDVGCGIGEFLFEAKKKGFEVHGLDFDKEAIKVAKNYFGLSSVEPLSIEDYLSKIPNQKFDFVTLFDVLEHLDNPRQTLNLIWWILTKEGVVAFTVPNRETISFLKPHDLPPRHLSRWSERSIAEFLRRNGFEIIKIKKIPPSLYYIVMRLKFKYGKFLSWGIVRRMEEREGVVCCSSRSSVLKKPQSKRSPVGLLRKIAKARDMVAFLIPSLAIYLYLCLVGRQFLSLYILAKKKV